jgi:catechol 2,3-dioxygenase-like lactoylglutathione lyase family enzyme
VVRLHHVQVTCPRGGEEAARHFYGEGLGLTEVEKPAALADRGGVWFRSHDELGQVVTEVHVGVEEPFVPTRQAHPAFLMADEAGFEAVVTRLERLGYAVDRGDEGTFPGYRRVHTRDDPGNRVELLV